LRYPVMLKEGRPVSRLGEADRRQLLLLLCEEPDDGLPMLLL
jgi:hypothetical protein